MKTRWIDTSEIRIGDEIMFTSDHIVLLVTGVLPETPEQRRVSDHHKFPHLINIEGERLMPNNRTKPWTSDCRAEGWKVLLLHRAE